MRFGFRRQRERVTDPEQLRKASTARLLGTILVGGEGSAEEAAAIVRQRREVREVEERKRRQVAEDKRRRAEAAQVIFDEVRKNGVYWPSDLPSRRWRW